MSRESLVKKNFIDCVLNSLFYILVNFNCFIALHGSFFCCGLIGVCGDLGFSTLVAGRKEGRASASVSNVYSICDCCSHAFLK